MILLCLDTSGPVAGVALMENGAVRYEAMAVNEADANAAVAGWVARGLESMKRSASAGALDLAGVLAALKSA